MHRRLARSRAIWLLVPLTVIAACGGDDDEGGADATIPLGDVPEAATGEGPCTSLEEGTIEELFDVTVTPAPDGMNSATFCSFGVDGSPGHGFDVASGSEAFETFDDAVAQMESEAGPAEGSGVRHMDLGDGAAGWSSSGIAFVVVSDGDRIVQVSANLPPGHRLTEDDDALLELTTQLADEVT